MLDSGRCHLEAQPSDVNRLRRWHKHVRTSYVCPMTFDMSSTSRFAYVTITIMFGASAKFCLFLQRASDINDLVYVTECKIACVFGTIILKLIAY